MTMETATAGEIVQHLEQFDDDIRVFPVSNGDMYEFDIRTDVTNRDPDIITLEFRGPE